MTPMFVDTSEGYINLSLVTQIKKLDGRDLFIFSAGNSVELPRDETKWIMHVWKQLWEEGTIVPPVQSRRG
jgi:hypothetical protein